MQQAHPDRFAIVKPVDPEAVLGLLAALTGGVLLLTSEGHPGRRSGAVVVGAVVLLSLVDAVALADDDGGARRHR